MVFICIQVMSVAVLLHALSSGNAGSPVVSPLCAAAVFPSTWFKSREREEAIGLGEEENEKV